MKFEKTQALDTDVLIIGGGSAGLWTACQFKQQNPDADVLIVDKGPKDWGGLMAMSGGDFEAILPQENVDDWVDDLVYYWDGLCDQPLMKTLLSGFYDRFQDYQAMGCDYLRDEAGALRGVPQRHLAHCKLYVTREKGYGGERMAAAMVRTARARGVRSMGRVLVTELLKSGDRVVGAVGFHTVSGVFFTIRARAVVLACGMAGWKTSYMKNTTTGEWVDLALRAGVEMQNFEFGRVWNVPKRFSWEGQTTLLPLGARYVNAAGEPFMDRYSPDFGANTDPHYVTVGMALEAKAGRAPIYLDLHALDRGQADVIKPRHGWQALNYNKLQANGIDFFEDTVEWVPQLTVSFGGAVADEDGRTCVEGLYVTGSAHSLDPGVYIGGFGLATTAQMGYRTGMAIAQDLQHTPAAPALDAQQVEQHRCYLSQLSGQQGLRPKAVLQKIQELVFPYDVSILKTEKSLQRAWDGLQALREELACMSAHDPHELLKQIEVRGIFRVTELYLQASMLRKESRAGHYREDYPAYDDANWLAWIVLSEQAGVLKSRKASVPLGQYPHPLRAHYFDHFNFGGRNTGI